MQVFADPESELGGSPVGSSRGAPGGFGQPALPVPVLGSSLLVDRSPLLTRGTEQAHLIHYSLTAAASHFHLL